MPTELAVLLEGVLAAVVHSHRGELTLSYEESWRIRDDSYPLSLSMPLAQREHGDAVVRAYMEGLLPDNSQVLEQWGRRFGVSARNPFSLLTHVGEDVAGAAQFVVPERLKHAIERAGDIEWTDEAGIADTLRTLAVDQSAWRRSTDAGQFSLAGAQPKTALFRDDGRWGIPTGAVPTTHILKPPLIGLDRFAENEHLCLRLAQELEISAANSSVIQFEDQQAIVVERYDRAATDGRVVRLHQEDMCQAVGVTPRAKYESEGGPGANQILPLLRDHSSAAAEDLDRFLDALALNWVIGGTDAHAKNYSVLIGAAGVRLAPIYDVASVLTYEKEPIRNARLAMRIGGEYRVGRVRRRHWERLASENGLDPDHVVARVGSLATAATGAVDHVVAEEVAQGINEEFALSLSAAIKENSQRCLAALGG